MDFQRDDQRLEKIEQPQLARRLHTKKLPSY
jgi:hypothetical protein